MTDNTISCQYDNLENSLYFLDEASNIKNVKCFHFQSLFKNYKTRCKKNYAVDKIFENLYNTVNLNKIKSENNSEKNEENFYLNNEILINESEDKIFSFKILMSRKNEKIFIMNRLNRISVYFNN